MPTGTLPASLEDSHALIAHSSRRPLLDSPGADSYRDFNEGTSEAERQLEVQERSEPRAGNRSRTA